MGKSNASVQAHGGSASNICHFSFWKIRGYRKYNIQNILSTYNMFWERGRRGHDGTREGRAAMDASRRVTLNDPSHLLGQQCFEVLLTSLIFVQKLPQPLGDALLYNVQLVCSALWRCLFTLMIAHLTQQLMKSKEQLYTYMHCKLNRSEIKFL